MDEILRSLPESSKVLDLGSADGSFDACDYAHITIVRVDLASPNTVSRGGAFARADAAHLPFADAAFDAAVCNHSLEHMTDLPGTLRELGRVLRQSGSLYVSVPDASTLSDRLYRWLGRGGGHVNMFTESSSLISLIEELTGLRHVSSRVLFTSLSFLNTRNPSARPPRRVRFVGAGNETVLILVNALVRLIDRLWGTRYSVYGWALYFGSATVPISTTPSTNVCVRCGSAHDVAWLQHTRSLVCWRLFFKCPRCSACNFFQRKRSSNQR